MTGRESLFRISPLGRIGAIRQENRNLRAALQNIAANGDRHNGEVSRAALDKGFPESWAARCAYMALNPGRRVTVTIDLQGIDDDA